MTTLITAPVDSIGVHPRNPRRDVGDVTELAASITARGVLEPLVVIPAPPTTDTGTGTEGTGTEAAGRFLLVAGHRRLAAARAAGLAEVPALLRDDLTREADQLSAMLVENLMRRDLTPVEEAAAYQVLLDLQVDVTQIAAATGRSLTTVKSRLRLARISDAARERVHDGTISLDDAERLASLLPHPDLYAEAEKAVGRSDWSWTWTRLSRTLDARKDRAAVLRKARRHGWQVVDEPEGSWRIGHDRITVADAEADPTGVQVWTRRDHADVIRLRPTTDTADTDPGPDPDGGDPDGGDPDSDGGGVPARHPDARWVRDPDTGAMRYETAEEVAARQEREEAYRIAADLRAAWLDTFCGAGVTLTPGQQRTALAAALVAVTHHAADPDVTGTLGVLTPAEADGMASDTDWTQAITRVAAWPLARLVKALFAAASGAAWRLDGGSHGGATRAAAEWAENAGQVYAALTAVGYQATAGEADLLDLAAQHWTRDHDHSAADDTGADDTDDRSDATGPGEAGDEQTDADTAA